VVATSPLRMNTLHTGASTILLLPNIPPSRDRPYQPVIPLGVKIECSSIAREETPGMKEALASAQSRWEVELEAAPLPILAPVNYLETSKTGVCAII